MGADHIAVQQGHLTAAFQQQRGQDFSGGGLARTAQTGEPDADALAVARRVHLLQDFGGFLAGEPLGQQLALGQVFFAHLGAGDVEGSGAFGYLVDFFVAVLVRQVNQFFEFDRFDADFAGILGHHQLRFVRAVERAALAVIARTGVVAADDQVVGAVIAADDGVPDGLARAGHAHGQREQAQHGAALFVVVLVQGAVDAHAGVVVHVAGLGQADHRVDQQAAADFLGRPLGQFFVDAVHRVAGLEGDHVAVAHLFQGGANFGRGAAQFDKVVVDRQVDDLDFASNIYLAPAHHFGNQRVLRIDRTQHQPSLAQRIVVVNIFDLHDRQGVVARVVQRNRLTPLGQGALVDRQGYRDREEHPVLQAHFGQYAFVIGLAHEAVQRRKRAGGQQFQVAQGAG